MKKLLLVTLLNIFSLQMEARAESLNEAVNQVKSEGRVLSAKTVNNKHEIKVLTPSGTVKTYNIAVTPKNTEPRDLKNDNPIGQNMRDSKRKSDVPDRFNNKPNNKQPDNRQKNSRKLNDRQMNLHPRLQNDVQVKKKKDK